MNTVSNPDFYCYCRNFIDELIPFYREISSVKSQRLKWRQFKEFTIHYPSRFTRINGDINSTQFRTPCEQNIYMGLYKLFTEKNIRLSTLLLNIIAFHYFKVNHFHICSFVRYLEEDENLDRDDNIRLSLIALNGQTQFMKLLLNFNLLNLDGDVCRLEFATLKIIEEFAWMHARVYPHTKEAKAIEILKYAMGVYFPGNYEEKLKRICLTTFCIQVILLKLKNRENEANDCIHCLRMYFASTRDPFITRNEVRCMLYACFIVLENYFCYIPMYDYKSMKMYSEEFVKLMPDSSVKLKPRNLTDLIRCEIRKNLKNCNLTLPQAVQKLRLPQQLKEFILGDELCLSRMTRNVSTEEIISIPELAHMFSMKIPTMKNISPIWPRGRF